MITQPGRRIALLVATDMHSDSTFTKLAAPSADATALADVLGDPSVGGYEVTVLVNPPAAQVTRQVETTLTQARHNDVVVFYFSGHGIKDESGQLYLAATDSEHHLPRSTTIPAQFIREQLDRSICRRKIVLLDCCFGGAFPRGYSPRANETVPVYEQLGGRGCVVLTASTALEYAYEIDGRQDVSALGGGAGSIFTAVVLQGLRTGAADLNGDGLIDVDELYRYTYEQVREKNPKQTPSLDCAFIGPLVIARNPLGPRLGFGIPQDVAHALGSPLSMVRLAAVGYLADFIHGADRKLADHARVALARLTKDANTDVAAAARDGLSGNSPAQIVGHVHEEANKLVADRAQQQELMNQMFINLARRSQSLVERQLSIIDHLEEQATDPDQLTSLFELDHLVTRMRRNAESLLVLSGTSTLQLARSVPAADIIGAAISETEHYARIVVLSVPEASVPGRIVYDLVHLIAELLDNATFYSEPEKKVTVRAIITRQQELGIQITDEGIGIAFGELVAINSRLADPPEIDVEATRRMGLYVVGRLANRHNIKVRLRENEDAGGGVIALIFVPSELVQPT